MTELWPTSTVEDALATVLGVSDSGALPSPRWLEVGEELLERLGRPAEELTLHVGSSNSHGSYGRTKKKAMGLLADAADSGVAVSLRLSSKPVIENCFFPSDVQFLASRQSSFHAEFAINLNTGLDIDPIALCHQIGSDVFEISGPSYGFAFSMPASLGPASYLATVVAKRAGADFAPFQTYADRMIRFRRNVMRGHHPCDGYMREVYEVNFLLEAHLAMPFGSGRLEAFLRRVGTVEVSGFAEGVFCWRVPPSSLGEVRFALEDSGLILSSATAPINLSTNTMN